MKQISRMMEYFPHHIYDLYCMVIETKTYCQLEFHGKHIVSCTLSIMAAIRSNL